MSKEKVQEENQNQTPLPQINFYGNSILNQKAEAIDFDKNQEELDRKIIKMIATMYSFGGIGLAGPQISIMDRIIVWDHKWIISKKKYENLNVMINPEIIGQSERDIGLLESCLSIPEVEGLVHRPKEITVRYIDDENFETKEETFNEMSARVIQHEIDHLDGILFVNKMSNEERNFISPFLIALRKANKDIFTEREKQ